MSSAPKTTEQGGDAEKKVNLNATAKVFTFKPSATEFKPKWMDPSTAAPVAAAPNTQAQAPMGNGKQPVGNNVSRE